MIAAAVVVYLTLVGVVGLLSRFDSSDMLARDKWSVILLGPLALLVPVLFVLGTLFILSVVLS